MFCLSHKKVMSSNSRTLGETLPGFEPTAALLCAETGFTFPPEVALNKLCCEYIIIVVNAGGSLGVKWK